MNNQPELFPVASVTKDTPRLAWMKWYGIRILEDKWAEDEEEKWACWTTQDPSHDETDVGMGSTEHDAIAAWAIKHGVRLWNEQGI